MESLEGALVLLIPWLEGSRSLEQVEESWGPLSLGSERAAGRLELSRFSRM